MKITTLIQISLSSKEQNKLSKRGGPMMGFIECPLKPMWNYAQCTLPSDFAVLSVFADVESRVSFQTLPALPIYHRTKDILEKPLFYLSKCASLIPFKRQNRTKSYHFSDFVRIWQLAAGSRLV